MTAPNSPAWYDTAATRAPAPAPENDPATERTQTLGATAPVVGKTRRTVSARIAAAIGVVAFLLGVGVSALTGPLLGGPGGPGGPGDGGQGGPPGTSQQSGTTGTGTGT
ncbi:hypothetical protein [Actinomycetospora sp. CA-084318]|uniref:hypothetical protein n=1 Tax=Actinomycetospora sp. CA-084318 TaxID=3239892 RepID=UPI003D967DBA